MQLSGYAGTGMLWHMAARLWLRTVRNERGIAPRGPHPQLNRVSGDYAGGETPLPIPNRAVKPAEADGTWGETPWESRKSPGLFNEPSRKRRLNDLRKSPFGMTFAFKDHDGYVIAVHEGG